MSKQRSYVGLDKDLAQGDGITPIAKTILDARLFGLIGEQETCLDWPGGKIQELFDKVNQAWEPYGSLPSLLPTALREQHAKAYDAAILMTRKSGWNPDQDLENER